MKQRLTEDEKLRRRAARKAEAKNARLRADAGPLYADQVPAEEFTGPQAEYWAMRRSWAEGPRGHEAAYLAGIDWKVDLLLLRNQARRVMSPADFATADAAQDRHGDRARFWRNILTGGQRLVLSHWRHVYGVKTVVPQRFPAPSWTAYLSGEPFMVENRVECGEKLVWPPAGWQAPFTPEALDQWFRDLVPEPRELPGQVDPLGLARHPVRPVALALRGVA